MGHTLTETDLPVVVEELHEAAAKWKQIGTQLGMSTGTLNEIEVTSRDSKTQLLEMVTQWLKKVDPLPTWEAVIEVLKKGIIGEARLADQLKNKHCKENLAENSQFPSGQPLPILLRVNP